MKNRYIYTTILLALLLPISSPSYGQTPDKKDKAVKVEKAEKPITKKETQKDPKKEAPQEGKKVDLRDKAKADQKYANYAYIDAIALYERMVEKGLESADVYQKIGDAYYYNAQYDKSAKWYTKLFELPQTSPSDQPKAEYYYRYAQSLKSVGQYDKANSYLEQFASKQSTDQRAKNYQSHKDYQKAIKANSGRYNIENSGVNSPYSDYGACVYNNYVIFTSARDTGTLVKRRHKWTNQSFTNLYVAKQDKNGKLTGEQPFNKEVKSKYHESTPIIAPDGKTVYFTRNNIASGKKGETADKTKLLKIYQATVKDGKLTGEKELPFNSNKYNCAHPAISPDGKTLYFASDMPGGKGQSDLYKVEIKNNGTSFGKPENLGENINTEGRETFPFITEQDELYFSSDGHPGLGGLDIFGTRKEKDGTYQTIHNVGEPVNGNMDDFAFSINSQNKRGYFSSNRTGGKGYDDIYNLLETKPLFVCDQQIAGKVINQENGQAIEGAVITLYDTNFQPIKGVSVTTDKDGNYQIKDVECNKQYYVRAEKPNYHTQEQYVSVPDERGETTQDIALEPKQKEIALGTDLFKLLQLNPILFDLDKSNIRPDAAKELDKVVAALKEYPSMRIDIRSHTDSRGKDAYNEKLSDRRAKSTREYMITVGGINESRITAKGYGEYKLLNKCGNGVKCSEEEHQENRRSEFIVVEM